MELQPIEKAQWAADPECVERANMLAAELEGAFGDLRGYLNSLQELLNEPQPNTVQLTILRLKLSHLRLARGSLVAAISRFLEGKVTEPEAQLLRDLRSAHQCLLQAAVIHTTKWTLDAVEANWSEYRKATSAIADQWLTKAQREQDILYPLIAKYADIR